MTEVLDPDGAADALADQDGWEYEPAAVSRRYALEDFQAALAVVEEAAAIAEDLHHHPDISIQDYNEVVVRLTTHDAGGVTDKDLAFIEQLEARLEGDDR